MKGNKQVGKRALRRSTSSRRPFVNGKKFWAACAALSLCLSTFPTVANAEEIDPLGAGIEESIQAQSAGLEEPTSEVQEEAPADEAPAASEGDPETTPIDEPATSPEPSESPATANTDKPVEPETTEAKPAAKAKLQAKTPAATSSPSPSADADETDERASSSNVSTFKNDGPKPIKGNPNPPIAPRCGLNVVLIMDRSYTISAGELTLFKDSAKSFVNSLLGTSGQVAVGSFGTAANEVLAPTFLTASNSGTIAAAIDSIPESSRDRGSEEYTNWEGGLTVAQTLKDKFAPGMPSIVVFLTDGEPTADGVSHKVGTSDDDNITATNSAVPVANALKADGVRIFGVMIGGESVSNLQNITGYTKWDSSRTILTSDYTTTTDFGKVGGLLTGVVGELCQQVVEIQKLLIPAGGGEAVPQAGVSFDVESLTQGATVDRSRITTSAAAGDLGRAQVNVEFPAGKQEASIAFDEDSQEGTELVSIECSPNKANQVNLADGTWSVKADKNLVKCTVVNKDTRPTLTLVKKVDNTQSGSAKATDFVLEVDDARWNTTRVSDTEAKTATTAVAPGTFQLKDGLKEGYDAGKWTCVNTAKGNATVLVTDKGAGLGQISLNKGDYVKCEITNTGKPLKGTLELVKKVVDPAGLGSMSASDFVLKVDGSPWTLTGSSAQATSGAIAVNAGEYTLSEDSYDTYDKTSFVCEAPGKTPQTVASGSKVKIGRAEAWKCTITNTLKTADLTLIKKVTNDNGGTKTAADFLLSADGPTAITNVAPISSGADVLTGQVQETVKPGTYTLSEKNLAGYKAGNWTCEGATLNGNSLTLKHGDQATCTITNDDIAPEIRLAKRVVNDNGGTSLPGDFLLTATPATGTAGPGVSAQASLDANGSELEAGVIKGYTDWSKTSAGTYVLGEEQLNGYEISENWVCEVDGTKREVSEGKVQLGLGEKLDCVIVNDDIKSALDIEKTGIGTAEWISKNSVGDDSYQATFKIAVTAEGHHPRVYTLTDELEIDESALIGGITVTNDSGVAQESIASGSRSFVIATDVSITDTQHEYTVVVDFTIPKDSQDGFDLVCGENGGGFPNKAIAKSGDESKSDTDCVPIGESPEIDLDIVKTVAQQSANNGDLLTYTIEVTNNSEIPSKEYRITDALPSYLEFVEVTKNESGLEVAPPNSDNEIVVKGAAGLGAGQSVSLEFTARVVAQSDELLAEITNTACVENQFDPDEEDCSPVTIPVNPELRLIKNVENRFGGSATPGSFELKATPAEGLITPIVAAPAALDSEGEPLAASELRGYTDWAKIVAGDFTLSESGLEGYSQLGAWSCSVANSPERSVIVSQEGVFTAKAGERIECEVTNLDVPSELAIEKVGLGNAEWLERTESDDLYKAQFLISVTAKGVHPRNYTLSDTLGIDETATIGAISVSSENGITVNEIEPGSREFTIVDDVEITNETHEYIVVVEFAIPRSAISYFDYWCGYETDGFPNLAKLTPYLEGDQDVDETCVDIPEPPSIDLSLEKTAILEEDEEFANVGGNITYELVVTNSEESDRAAFDFTVTDYLPEYVTLVGEPTVPEGVVLDSSESGVLVFEVPEGLEPGQAITISFVTKYDPPLDLPRFEDIENTACVASEFDDSDRQPLDRRAQDEDGEGGTANDCDTTVTPVNPLLTLVKTVDNGEYGSNVAADFLLSAQGPRGWESEAPVPVDEADPSVAAISKNVLQGEFLVWEDQLEDYDASEWTCELREQQIPRTISGTTTGLIDGEELPANSIGFGLDNGDNMLCTITNTGVKPVIDLDITKDVILEDGATAIDLGETFKYLLTVTNNSERTAREFTVTDHLPEHMTVEGVEGLPTGWTEDDSVEGKYIFHAAAGLEAGESASVTLLVKYDPPRRVDGVFVNVFEPVLNTACVESEFDPDSPEEDCDDVEVPIKQINPNAFVECKYDVPYVTFNMSTTNYTLVPGSTMYMNWYEVDGTELLHTDTYTVDENGVLQGSQLWPGSAVDEDGISVLWPGWRPAGPGETPTWEHLVLDPDYHTYVFRSPLRVEFVLNPTAIIDALYPPADPNCAVDRDADLKLEKTASVEELDPGQEFTYELAARNDGMGSLKDVKIGDEIPADIAITDIAFDGDVFPTWKNCAITGKKDGYGGMLECELNGYAPPEAALPVLTLTAKLNPDTKEERIVNSAAVCGLAVDTSEDTLMCGEDDVTTPVNLPVVPVKDPVPPLEATPIRELPKTGASPLLPLWAAVLVLVGAGFQLTNRRRSERAS